MDSRSIHHRRLLHAMFHHGNLGQTQCSSGTVIHSTYSMHQVVKVPPSEKARFLMSDYFLALLGLMIPRISEQTETLEHISKRHPRRWLQCLSRSTHTHTHTHIAPSGPSRWIWPDTWLFRLPRWRVCSKTSKKKRDLYSVFVLVSYSYSDSSFMRRHLLMIYGVLRNLALLRTEMLCTQPNSTHPGSRGSQSPGPFLGPVKPD